MKTQHKTTGKGTLEVVANTTGRAGSDATALRPNTAGKGKRKTACSSETNTRPGPALTHQRIAERAREIWLERGCPSGRDELNWQEAEAQLHYELGPNR